MQHSAKYTVGHQYALFLHQCLVKEDTGTKGDSAASLPELRAIFLFFNPVLTRIPLPLQKTWMAPWLRPWPC